LGSYAVISWVVLNALGYDFVGAIGYIYATRPDLYPFALPPWYYFFLRVITDNPIVLFLGLFGTYLSILLLVMMDMIINTRYVFAWSFDRLLPAALADVSDRFHAPLKSILLTLVIGEIMYAGILFYGWSSFVSTAIFWMIVSFLVVAVTAILFPFRRKEIYNLSPLKAWNLRKIPVISLIGTACLVYLLIHVYYFYAYPDFAAFFGALTPSTGASTLVLYAAGVAIFYTARWYRAKQGIDISLIFREIPPE
jgi:amino acid transporter